MARLPAWPFPQFYASVPVYCLFYFFVLHLPTRAFSLCTYLSSQTYNTCLSVVPHSNDTYIQILQRAVSLWACPGSRARGGRFSHEVVVEITGRVQIMHWPFRSGAFLRDSYH